MTKNNQLKLVSIVTILLIHNHIGIFIHGAIDIVSAIIVKIVVPHNTVVCMSLIHIGHVNIEIFSLVFIRAIHIIFPLSLYIHILKLIIYHDCVHPVYNIDKLLYNTDNVDHWIICVCAVQDQDNICGVDKPELREFK